jgi:hypothetical protein
VFSWAYQLAGGVIAIIIAWLMWRFAWRRVGDEPHCARCGYDLRGRPADAARCAECGADLRLRRAVGRGMPQRHTRRQLYACLLLVIAGGLIASGIGGAWRDDWRPYKPFGWLLGDLQSADAPRRLAAEGELQRRFTRLTQPQHLALVDARYSVNGAATGISSITIQSALKLRRASQLDDARWDNLCRKLVNISLATRPAVRHGDPIAFRASVTPMAGLTQLHLMPAIDVDDANVNKIALEPDMGGLTEARVRTARECCGVLTAAQWKDLSPGQHRLEVVTLVQLRLGATGEQCVWQATIPVSSLFTVVAKPPPAVDDAPFAPPPPALINALQPRSIGPGWINVQLGDRSSPLTSDVAFNVFLRQGAMELFVGSFHALRGSSAPYRFHTPPLPLATAGFDIILRPSPREAARSMRLQNEWPTQILFQDVNSTRTSTAMVTMPQPN